MTEQQKQVLEELIDHIKNNAEELIDNTSISNQDMFMYLYKKGFDYLKNQSLQNIVDIGALGIAYTVRNKR